MVYPSIKDNNHVVRSLKYEMRYLFNLSCEASGDLTVQLYKQNKWDFSTYKHVEPTSTRPLDLELKKTTIPHFLYSVTRVPSTNVPYGCICIHRG